MKTPRWDTDAYNQFPHLRWVYDRLYLSEILEYQCGPATIEPPKDGLWFVKPHINLVGMGLGAHRYTGMPIPAGSFWMPYFTGQQISIDFHFDENSWKVREALSVEFENERPKLWTRLSPSLDYCDLVPSWMFGNFQLAGVIAFNVECIDNNIIEMHLRWGHDFDAAPPGTKYAEVVWADNINQQPYIKDYEDCFGALEIPRLGFRYY